MESKAETETQADNEIEKESISIQDLLKENSDMYGWIEIEETTLSYPVMYTPDNSEFYLNHNFDKEESPFGVPFIDGENNPKTDMHIVIYEHLLKAEKCLEC